MRSLGRLRVSLLPLLVLSTGTVGNCDLSTDASTGELHLTGTVHFLEAENGCWLVESDNGRRYELRPDQAPERIFRDGARVRLMVVPSASATGVCRSATPVDVNRVLSVQSTLARL